MVFITRYLLMGKVFWVHDQQCRVSCGLHWMMDLRLRGFLMVLQILPGSAFVTNVYPLSQYITICSTTNSNRVGIFTCDTIFFFVFSFIDNIRLKEIISWRKLYYLCIDWPVLCKTTSLISYWMASDHNICIILRVPFSNKNYLNQHWYLGVDK